MTSDSLSGVMLTWRLVLDDGRVFEFWTRSFSDAMSLLFGATGGWRNGAPVLEVGIDEVTVFCPLVANQP